VFYLKQNACQCKYLRQEKGEAALIELKLFLKGMKTICYKKLVQINLKKNKLQVVSAKYLRDQKDLKIKIVLPKMKNAPSKRN
jgi:hypothetical protein